MRPLRLRVLSIISESRSRLRYDAEFQWRTAAPDVEFQCLPCLDPTLSLGLAIGGDGRQSDVVTGEDSITYLETSFVRRKTAAKFSHEIVPNAR